MMMRPLTIAGLDPSLTSFGVAITHGPAGEVFLERLRPGKMREHERLNFLLGSAEGLVGYADVAVVEGLSLGSKGSAVTALAGLHWLVRHMLWRLGIPYAVVPPYKRCKYITGQSLAPKDECLAAVIKRFPEIDVHGNDEADALTLAQMAADAYGQPLVQMPQDRTDTLRALSTSKGHKGEPAILWPELPGALIH